MPNVDIANPMFQQPVAMPAPQKPPAIPTYNPALQVPNPYQLGNQSQNTPAPAIPTAPGGGAAGGQVNQDSLQTQPPPAVPSGQPTSSQAYISQQYPTQSAQTAVPSGQPTSSQPTPIPPEAYISGLQAGYAAAQLPQNQAPSYHELMIGTGALNGFLPTQNPDGTWNTWNTLPGPVTAPAPAAQVGVGSAGGGGGSGSGNGGGGAGNGGGSAGGGTTTATPEAIMPGTADIPTMMRELVNMRQGNRMVIPNWLQTWMNRFAPGLGQRFSDILHMLGFQSTGNLGTGGFPSSFLVPTGLNMNALTEQALSEMSNLEQLAIRAILSMNLNDQYVQGLTQEEAQQLQDQTGLVAAPTVTPPELTQGVVTPEYTTP